MRKAAKLALSTTVAAAAGYVAGILTAPKSGKETRKDIHDKALSAKKEAEKKLKTLNTELGELITTTKTKAKDATDSAKTELQKAADMATSVKEKAREVLSSVREGEVDDKDLKKAVNDVNSAIDNLKKYLKKHG